MSNVILTLGGIPFQDMEVPEKIFFGGSQRLAIQNTIGGGKIVGVLGVDQEAIRFSGIFSGDDAVNRAQLLDAARAEGAELPLVWDGFFYSVIVEKFSAVYQKRNLIPFTISCVVIESDPGSSAASFQTVTASVAADILTAETYGVPFGILVESMPNKNMSEVSAAQNLIGDAIERYGTTLNVARTLINHASDVDMGISVILQSESAAEGLGAMMAMSGYVNRAAANMSNQSL